MTIKVELPPSLLVELQAQATAAGKDIEALVVEAVQARLALAVKPSQQLGELTHSCAVAEDRAQRQFEDRCQQALAQIEPLILRSQQAFWRDLPQLQKNKSKKRRWAAYHGEERIGLGPTKTQLYQECLRRGLEPGEFYVGSLDRDPTVPPWAFDELEHGFFGFGFWASEPEPPAHP